MPLLNRLVVATGLLIGLAGCGGGSSTNAPVSPGDPGTDPGSGEPRATCQQDFTPERVAAGENCDPNLNRTQFCPLVPGAEYLRSRSEVIACDGVTVSKHPIVGGGFQTDYVAIRSSAGGAPSAVYLALHYLGASADYQANLTRLSELAKARNVLVVVPQAPGIGGLLPLPDGLPPVDGNFLARWPTALSQPVESYLQLLDATVADARVRFGAGSAPLYAAGLSNGVPMAYFYACGRADRVDAILAVAGNQNNESASACQPSRAVGLVIIHGTADPIIAYGGLLGLTRPIPTNFEDFKALNQCVGSDGEATLVGAQGDVRLDFAPDCAGGRRVVLASLLGGGHNWPGDDSGLLLGLDLPVGPFGPARNDIDATIQGFDLLRYAAGD